MLEDDKPKAVTMTPEGVMIDEWWDLASDEAGWRLEGCDHSIEVVFNRATSSEESPEEVDVDPPWRILSSQLGLSHKDDDLQEVKGRVGDERGANSARRNIS